MDDKDPNFLFTAARSILEQSAGAFTSSLLTKQPSQEAEVLEELRELKANGDSFDILADPRMKELLAGLLNDAEMEIVGEEVVILLKVPNDGLEFANRIVQAQNSESSLPF